MRSCSMPSSSRLSGRLLSGRTTRKSTLPVKESGKTTRMTRSSLGPGIRWPPRLPQPSQPPPSQRAHTTRLGIVTSISAPAKLEGTSITRRPRGLSQASSAEGSRMRERASPIVFSFFVVPQLDRFGKSCSSSSSCSLRGEALAMLPAS